MLGLYFCFDIFDYNAVLKGHFWHLLLQLFILLFFIEISIISRRRAMKKALSATTETITEIHLKNDFIQINVSKENGNVTEILNLMTGKSILGESENLAFTTLNTSEEVTLLPSSVRLENDNLVFNFKDAGDVCVLAENHNNYIALTLNSELPHGAYSFSFGILTADYEWELDNENAFGLSGIAMTTTVHPEYFPGGSLKVTKGTVYTGIDVPLKGSKFGIAFSRMTEHRDHLKSIVDDIDPTKGITSKHGGPYALDNKDLFGDYVLLHNGLTPETVEETVMLAKEYSVEQIDIHQGDETIVQADFNFVCAATEEEKEKGEFIEPEIFKKRIADKVTAKGVQLGLHTYSSLIPKYAKEIVTNPKWQKQICYDPITYTVKGELSADDINILTHEDASNIDVTPKDMPYNRNFHTRYLLVDEEIILIEAGSESGFPNVQRGALGTKASSHKDGAEIRQLLGWFTMFQSIPLSELFYHIAERTADAYNRGGFEMIYLDGVESFARDGHCPKEKVYYAYAEFVRAVVSSCDTPPLIEYSSFYPHIWNARGRGGAIDFARRGFKEFKNYHFGRQEKFHDYFYTATVGWFNYAPDKDEPYKNTITQTMFRDDLDHMGSLALANNFGTVCQPFSVREINIGTMLADNFKYYCVYSKLREADYFAPEVKKEILARKHEHKVFKQADGTWAFKEMEYLKHKVWDTSETNFATGEASNPFNAQTPYVRIEQNYSSFGENSIVVKDFDETKPVADLVGEYKVPETSYIDNYAFKMRIHGNGSDSDALVVTLSSYDGKSGYYIPMNFEGWRDIVLIEPTDWGRQYCRLMRLSGVNIEVIGDCDGVKIGNLVSVKIADAPVVNPSITVNGKTMTFNTELKSGEYVEYYPEFDKAYHTFYTAPTVLFDENRRKMPDVAHVEEISISDTVEIPTGSFSFVYDAEPKTDAPTRAKVVIGVSGAVIKNPDNWNTPEIDVPEGLEKIRLK